MTFHCLKLNTFKNYNKILLIKCFFQVIVVFVCAFMILFKLYLVTVLQLRLIFLFHIHSFFELKIELQIYNTLN